jgi:hypothetical protein
MAEHSPMFENRTQDSGLSWISIIVAVLVIGVIVAAVVFFSTSPPPQTQQALDKYAESLQIGSPSMSVAQNFVGANIHYVDGKIANVGGRTVEGIRVDVIFRDSMGQVVLRDTQNLMLLKPAQGDLPADVVSLKNSPLQPNEVASFRLTFEHLPADWNGGYPELRFVQVSLKPE